MPRLSVVREPQRETASQTPTLSVSWTSGSVDSASRVYTVKCVTLWQVDFSAPFLCLSESENGNWKGPLVSLMK